MTQAARSGRQNIIEGSERSATSKATEMKLTDVARASLSELRGDYEIVILDRGRRPVVWVTPDPITRSKELRISPASPGERAWRSTQAEPRRCCASR